MKNLLNFLFRVITLIILTINLTFGQTTTVNVNYNSIGHIPGDTISVPVVFTSTANVGTWQVVLYYNRDVLTYQSCAFDPAWSGFSPGVNNPFSLPSNSPQYPNLTCTKISWSTLTGPYVSCSGPSGRIAFTINFIYNGCKQII